MPKVTEKAKKYYMSICWIFKQRKPHSQILKTNNGRKMSQQVVNGELDIKIEIEI